MKRIVTSICGRLRVGRLSACLILLLAVAPLDACRPVPDVPAAHAAKIPTSPARITIYAPATPAAIPILIAGSRLAGAKVTIFANHAQANAEFLRGDVDILVTGLSVGMDLFENGAPVQVVNSYVTGMTYLVTSGRKVNRFADLKAEEVYLPFEGSPIEETTRFLVEQEGLTWKEDIRPVYAPFATSVELLKQGRAVAVALPEPSVSEIEKLPNVYISLSYREAWDEATGSRGGYPQVAPFVLRTWAAEHTGVLARFNAEVERALDEIREDPGKAVADTKDALGLPAEVLASSLARTDFAFSEGEVMAEKIKEYNATIGKRLDEKYEAFFYRGR